MPLQPPSVGGVAFHRCQPSLQRLNLLLLLLDGPDEDGDELIVLGTRDQLAALTALTGEEIGL